MRRLASGQASGESLDRHRDPFPVAGGACRVQPRAHAGHHDSSRATTMSRHRAAARTDWWWWRTPCRKVATRTQKAQHACEKGRLGTSLRGSRHRSPRHPGRGMAGDRDRARHLGVVRPNRSSKSAKAAPSSAISGPAWIGGDDHGLGAAALLRRREPGRYGPGRPDRGDRVDRRRRSGGTCIVRVVHSWFASTDDWDDQFEGTRMAGPLSSASSDCTSPLPRPARRVFQVMGVARVSAPRRGKR